MSERYDSLRMSSFRKTSLTAVLFAAAAPLVFAHAVLLDSTPKAGGVVAGPAIAVELRFNSRVDSKRSRLSLVTPDSKIYPLDIAAQHSPDTLTAPAKGLLPGNYKIRWQVLAADGHITRGEVPFTIK